MNSNTDTSGRVSATNTSSTTAPPSADGPSNSAPSAPKAGSQSTASDLQSASDQNPASQRNQPGPPGQPKQEVDSQASADQSLRAHKRRPHTKSRNGCTTCKRRRVKCDETRPVCKNCQHLRLECLYASPAVLSCADLQLMNLRLLYHYTTVVAKTVSDSGISTESIWARDVVEMGLDFPFLMHAILMFSATHLAQKQPKDYCNVVVQHRSMALTLLRSEVQHINSENLDPLVATSVLLILDAMANASLPSRMTPSSLPASTWLHHVRGAATILLAVGVLPPTSKFYSFMGFDLLDLASCYPPGATQGQPPPHAYSDLQCTIPELAVLYPVAFDSPYFSSLTFLDRLSDQRDRADFILRVFSFPALMDKSFVNLLASGDRYAKLIVSAYYRLVRQYVRDRQHRVWFLEGVSTVLPIDMDNEFGGLGFVTDALPIPENVDSILARFDAVYAAAEQKLSQMAGNNVAAVNPMHPHMNVPLQVPQQVQPPMQQPPNMNAQNLGQNLGNGMNVGPRNPQMNAGQVLSGPAMNTQAMNMGANMNASMHNTNMNANITKQASNAGHMKPTNMVGTMDIKMENLDDQFNQDYLDNMDIQFRPRQEFAQSPTDLVSATSSMSTPNHSLSASPQSTVQANMPLQYQQAQQPQVQQQVQQQQAQQLQQHLQMQTQVGNPGNRPGSNTSSQASVGGPTRPSSSTGGIQVTGYDPMLDAPHSLISELMPHTYGRIKKQISSAGASSGGYSANQWSRNRSNSNRPIPYMRARQRHIVRPGMMSVPMDPSIPNDLLGGFEFGSNGGNAGMDATPGFDNNEIDTDMGLEPTDLDPSTLEWQTPPTELQRPLNEWMHNRQDKSLEETMCLVDPTSQLSQQPQIQKPPQYGMNNGNGIGNNNNGSGISNTGAGTGNVGGAPIVKQELDDNLDRLINFDDDLGLENFD